MPPADEGSDRGQTAPLPRLKLFVAGPDELRQFVGDGPVLTDDKPMVEYFLSLPRDRDVNLSGVRGDVTRYVVQP